MSVSVELFSALILILVNKGLSTGNSTRVNRYVSTDDVVGNLSQQQPQELVQWNVVGCVYRESVRDFQWTWRRRCAFCQRQAINSQIKYGGYIMVNTLPAHDLYKTAHIKHKLFQF